MVYNIWTVPLSHNSYLIILIIYCSHLMISHALHYTQTKQTNYITIAFTNLIRISHPYTLGCITLPLHPPTNTVPNFLRIHVQSNTDILGSCSCYGPKSYRIGSWIRYNIPAYTMCPPCHWCEWPDWTIPIIPYRYETSRIQTSIGFEWENHWKEESIRIRRNVD